MMRKVGVLLGVAALGLAVAGCGGGDGETSSQPSTTTSGAEPTGGESGGGSSGGNVVYREALLTPEDLDFVSGELSVVDTGDMKDSVIRGVCGREGTGLGAEAGEFAEIQDAGTTMSITTSVQEFASEADAETAFAVTRSQADVCENVTTYEDQGGTFRPLETPPIVRGGEDEVTVLGEKTDTGLVVGDHFVRAGPYVFDIRFAVAGSANVLNSVGAIADTAVLKFDRWLNSQR
jgi:hypothetical protein